MSDSEQQKNLVLWGYIIQWASLLIPFSLLVSLVYLWVVRNRVTLTKLRSHINWQLGTCYATAAAIPVAIGLLFVGLSGVSTDAPLSIVATFVLVGLTIVVPVWILYRFIRGSIRFSQQLPMEKVFP